MCRGQSPLIISIIPTPALAACSSSQINTCDFGGDASLLCNSSAVAYDLFYKMKYNIASNLCLLSITIVHNIFTLKIIFQKDDFTQTPRTLEP